MRLKIFSGRGDEGKFDLEYFSTKKLDKVMGEYYELVPSVFYPRMASWIQKSLEADELPGELIDTVIRPDIDPLLAARRYRNFARRVSDLAWADVGIPVEVIAATMDQKRIAERADALELCRLWFTRALKNQMAAPVKIHITRDPAYRLGVPYPELTTRMQ